MNLDNISNKQDLHGIVEQCWLRDTPLLGSSSNIIMNDLTALHALRAEDNVNYLKLIIFTYQLNLHSQK